MRKNQNRKWLAAAALVMMLVFYIPTIFHFQYNFYLQTLISSLYTVVIIGMGFLFYLMQKTPDDFLRTGAISETKENHTLLDKSEKLKIYIDNIQFQREKINFPTLNGIKTQKLDEDHFLIFTQDYRTIRLHKDEVMNYCYALIESNYSYFQPGAHHIELSIKTNFLPPEKKEEQKK